MYGKSRIRNLPASGSTAERQPIMIKPSQHQSQGDRRNQNNSSHPQHYNTMQDNNNFPLPHLRSDDGGYLGPAAVHHQSDDDSYPVGVPSISSPPSQERTPRAIHFSNNPPQASVTGYKGNQESVAGSVETDSYYNQSDRQSSRRGGGGEGGACGGLSCEERTGCEQMLLMGVSLLLIMIIALATGLLVLQKGALASYLSTCQTRACIRAAGQILESLDESVEPCEDFTQFACGGWYANHPIPESTFRWSILDVLDETTLFDVKHLLEEKPAGKESVPVTEARKFYQACMNDSRWSEVGLGPLLSLLDEAGGMPMADPEWAPEHFHLEEVLAWTRRAGGQTLVTLTVSPDMVNNTHNTINLMHGILPASLGSMTNASQLMKKSHISFMKRTAQTLLRAKGLDQNETLLKVVEDDAEELWQFTVDLAKITKKNDPARNPWKTYNPMTIAEFSQFTNLSGLPFKIDWLLYIQRTFNETDIVIDERHRIIVHHKSYFKGLIQLLNRTSTRIVANFMLYQMVQAMAEETSSTLRDFYKSFDDPLWAFGRNSLRAWHDCSGKTRLLLQMAVGQLYVKKHSLDKVSHIAKKLVSDVAKAFRDMLISATWMSKNASQEALKKLDNMNHLVAYPDFLLDDDKLNDYMKGLPVLSTTDHFGNIMALSRWHGLRSLMKLSSTPSRSRWPTGPVEINAFYAALQNTIVIPGGVLQPPLFHHEEMAALNYGGIGAIVGHEITHGFDTDGHQFDWKGSLSVSWDLPTMALYESRSKCFEEQYSSYNVSDLLGPFDSAIGEMKIDGIQSKGENIADNGGLRAAWLAYKNHIRETGEELVLPGLQKYNQDQLFYIAFSRLWCMQFTPWALQYSLANDFHPPGQYRTLGALQNTEEFADTFNCAEGSNMNPEKKCILW